MVQTSCYSVKYPDFLCRNPYLPLQITHTLQRVETLLRVGTTTICAWSSAQLWRGDCFKNHFAGWTHHSFSSCEGGIVGIPPECCKQQGFDIILLSEPVTYNSPKSVRLLLSLLPLHVGRWFVAKVPDFPLKLWAEEVLLLWVICKGGCGSPQEPVGQL